MIRACPNVPGCGQIGPAFGQVGPGFDPILTVSVEFSWVWAKLGTDSAKFRTSRPDISPFFKMRPGFDQMWAMAPDSGPHKAEIRGDCHGERGILHSCKRPQMSAHSRIHSVVGRSRPNCCRCFPLDGQIWPTPASTWPKSTDFERVLAESRLSEQLSDNLGPPQ